MSLVCLLVVDFGGPEASFPFVLSLSLSVQVVDVFASNIVLKTSWVSCAYFLEFRPLDKSMLTNLSKVSPVLLWASVEDQALELLGSSAS